MRKSRNSSKNRKFRVGKSSSPPKYDKTELELASENINDIAIISKNNIMKVKEFMKNVQANNNRLNKKKISALKNAKSLEILKKSGFFNFEFFENKGNTTHFNITLEEIEKVFRLIDKRYNGQKITSNELQNKMKIINPNFPASEISTLTNGKGEIKATELFELLKDNELADFDPIDEVYKILSNETNDDIDIDKLQKIFEDLKMGTMDDKDKVILKECLTLEKEEKITKDAFKTLFSYLKDTTNPEDEIDEEEEEMEEQEEDVEEDNDDMMEGM